jgi:endonuclease-3
VKKPERKPPKARTGRRRAMRSKSAAPPLVVLERLKAQYPDARCALDHESPYQLIVATILSAQCTDARVNLVTPEVFRRYPGVHELARANPVELEEIIKSTGFFRNKTKSLIGMAQAVVGDHDGELPKTMEQLVKLPGVGRKTANVVLGNAFGIDEGIVVDTHVTRLSQLLGWTVNTDPEKIEQDLMQLFPKKEWTLLSHLLIFHGRQVCIARRPRHESCVLNDICPSARL